MGRRGCTPSCASGSGTRCSRKRVERLMRQAGVAGHLSPPRPGLHPPRRHANPPTISSNRSLRPDEPDRLWVMDVTEHPHRRRQGVPGGRARRLQPPGRGLVDRRSHPRRARRRRPPDGHLAAPATRQARPSRTPITDRSTRHGRSAAGSAPPACSARWASIGDCFDNSVAESFFGTLQLELLDEHHWRRRDQLALAIFDWIEAWYNPRRRHSYCKHAQPHRLRDRTPRHDHPHPTRPLNGGSSIEALLRRRVACVLAGGCRVGVRRLSVARLVSAEGLPVPRALMAWTAEPVRPAVGQPGDRLGGGGGVERWGPRSRRRRRG